MPSVSSSSRHLTLFVTLSTLFCSILAEGDPHGRETAPRLRLVSQASTDESLKDVVALPISPLEKISSPNASNPLVKATENVCISWEPSPPVEDIPSVKVGRMDQVMDAKTGQLFLTNLRPGITIENPSSTIPITDQRVVTDFVYLIIRKYHRPHSQTQPSFVIALMDDRIVDICKKVVGTRASISWHHPRVELNPDILLSHYDDFVQYRDELKKSSNSDEESKIRARYLNQLLSTLEQDFQSTLADLRNLRKNGEVTFDYLKYILKPRQLIYHKCISTGLPRLCELHSFEKINRHTGNGAEKPEYTIVCHATALVNVEMNDRGQRRGLNSRSTVVDKIEFTLHIPSFEGTIKAHTMPAYPLEYHSQRADVEDALLARGKKWSQLVDGQWKHMQYDGVGASSNNYHQNSKQYVSSRVVVDGGSYFRHNMNGYWPTRARGAAERESKNARNFTEQYSQDFTGEKTSPFLWDLSKNDLLTAPAVVHGYSMADKQWLEFRVEGISEIEWNKDAFPNLVLPPARKELLLSLIEAHRKETGLEDFMRGKGQGLIVHLFGPPGVGKTLSAEATSEYVRRPLFAISSGELGTTAAELDKKLREIFEISATWNAIVLIDEADVFLERRSLHEIQRNAMVAVFLRHIEYYRGILFLTTNRVQTFDEAFHSRIHVGLHYGDLDRASRAKIWRAFIKKLGLAQETTEAQVQELAATAINGRQIKNAARTAQSLALGRGEKLGYEHLADTLQAMVDFNSRH